MDEYRMGGRTWSGARAQEKTVPEQDGTAQQESDNDASEFWQLINIEMDLIMRSTL